MSDFRTLNYTFDLEFGITTFDIQYLIHLVLSKQGREALLSSNQHQQLRWDLFLHCWPLHSPVIGPSGTPHLCIISLFNAPQFKYVGSRFWWPCLIVL